MSYGLRLVRVFPIFRAFQVAKAFCQAWLRLYVAELGSVVLLVIGENRPPNQPLERVQRDVKRWQFVATVLQSASHPGLPGNFGPLSPRTRQSPELLARSDPSLGYAGPEEWASIFVATRFMEQVEAVGYGLPEDCDPEVITWVNDYRSPYSD